MLSFKNNKIFEIFDKRISNVNQAAFILAFFALLSQLLALLRDRSLAHFLGPSADLDVYYTAFRIPDLLYVVIISLASVTVVLPFLARKIDKLEEARKFFDSVFTIFLGAMILGALAVFFLMPILAPLIAPGFSGSLQKTLVTMSQIMLLSPILLGLSNLFGSVTQLFRRFFIFALSPVFYNIGILIGVLFFYPLLGIRGLALGVILGALFHFVIQLPTVARHRFLPRLSSSINWKEIKKMVSLSIPRAVGLSVNKLVFIVIIALASLVAEGSISIFNLSYNLQAVPLILIGVSYSVAAFPTLTEFFANHEMDNFLHQVRVAAQQIIFWSLPIVFLFIVLRAQIVRVILGSGQFSWDDTRLTAAALAIFSLAIIAESLVLLLVRAYYAAGKTKRPLLINLFSGALTIVLAFVFLKLFREIPFIRYFIESLLRVEGIPGTGILMLPLAFSLGAIVNFALLHRAFKKTFALKADTLLRKTFFQSLGASFVIGFVAYEFLIIFGKVFDLNTFWGIFLQGFLAGAIGIVAGIVVLKLMKNKILADIQRTLHSKFWKVKKIVVPGQEGM